MGGVASPGEGAGLCRCGGRPWGRGEPRGGESVRQDGGPWGSGARGGPPERGGALGTRRRGAAPVVSAEHGGGLQGLTPGGGAAAPGCPPGRRCWLWGVPRGLGAGRCP